MHGAAKCTGMSPRFSMVVGQSLIVIFLSLCRCDVRMRDGGGWRIHSILVFFFDICMQSILVYVNYLNMHSVINRKIGV